MDYTLRQMIKNHIILRNTTKTISYLGKYELLILLSTMLDGYFNTILC